MPPQALMRIVAILAVVLTLGDVQLAWAKKPKKPTVLILGDSISKGTGVAPENTYPSLLQKKIDEANLGFTIQNASVGGDSTAKALKRLENLLKFSPHVDVLVIELGFNDAAAGIPPKKIAENIGKVVDLIRAKQPHASLVIVAVQTPKNFKEEGKFQDVFKSIARNKHTEFVPSLLGDAANDSSMMQPDGIHPNAKGHAIAAENVWAVLKPLLQHLVVTN
jgi:acyl-CoA thioesterase-1